MEGAAFLGKLVSAPLTDFQSLQSFSSGVEDDYKEDEEDVDFGEEYEEYCEEFENDMIKKYGCSDGETYIFEVLAIKAFEKLGFIQLLYMKS